MADFDGDGKADVLRLLPTGSIELWWQDGQGAFSGKEVFRAPAELSALVVADLDLDQRPDVLALSAGRASVYVLRNPARQAGMRSPLQLVTTLTVGAAGSAPVALVAADFDGDGLPDLAVARAGDNSLAFWNNRSQ